MRVINDMEWYRIEAVDYYKPLQMKLFQNEYGV